MEGFMGRNKGMGLSMAVGHCINVIAEPKAEAIPFSHLLFWIASAFGFAMTVTVAEQLFTMIVHDGCQLVSQMMVTVLIITRFSNE
jgi:hypothetical protein